MKAIPSRLHAALADYVLQSWNELGMGQFIIQMEMDFEGRLDLERLSRAHTLLLDAEPVLGCRLIVHPQLPYWERLSDAERNGFCQTNAREDYERFMFADLDSTVDPQVKACVWRRPEGDRLLLKVAHQAADAGGTKDIAALLADLYGRLGHDPQYQPEPNLHGSREADQILRRIPRYAYPQLLWNGLRKTIAGAVPKRTLTLPLDIGPRAPWGYVVRHLLPDHVERLAQYGRARQATLNDLMVAAFYHALVQAGNWNGQSALRLQITLDLRRWHLPNERAEAVCNLSGYEYPFLGRSLGRDFDETLARVSGIMRRRKRNWPGLSEILLFNQFRRFTYADLVNFEKKLLGRAIESGNFPNALTNMGPIAPERVRFDDLRPTSAYLLTPIIYPPLFGIGLSGYAGSLTLSAGVPECARCPIESFFDALIAALPC